MESKDCRDTGCPPKLQALNFNTAASGGFDGLWRQKLADEILEFEAQFRDFPKQNITKKPCQMQRIIDNFEYASKNLVTELEEPREFTRLTEVKLNSSGGEDDLNLKVGNLELLLQTKQKENLELMTSRAEIQRENDKLRILLKKAAEINAGSFGVNMVNVQTYKVEIKELKDKLNQATENLRDLEMEVKKLKLREEELCACLQDVYNTLGVKDDGKPVTIEQSISSRSSKSTS